MQAVALATQVGMLANKLEAERAAHRDLRWWARRIGKATAFGKTECKMDFYPFLRHRPTGYAQALEKLLPDAFLVREYPFMAHQQWHCVVVSWSASR